MIKRLSVRIVVQETRWTFFTIICFKKCIVCLKQTKNKLKEVKDGTLKNNC